MRNDKEFKAKSREDSFIKETKPDIKLGRHGDDTEQKPVITGSKKNRMYQSRQEPTETAVNNQPFGADETASLDTKAQNPSENTVVYETEQPPQEPTQEQQNFDFTDNNYSDNSEIPRNDYIPPPDTKGKYRKRMYHTHTEHKAVDYDFTETGKRNADDVPGDTSPPADVSKEDGDYNIADTVQENKTEFSRSTDYNFGETAARTDDNIPFDKVNTKTDEKSEASDRSKDKKQQRLYDKSDKGKTADTDTKTESASAETAAPTKDVPFDRVKKFEKKAKKARAKADKAEQKLPHKTKIKKQRLYDEQKQKPKNRLQFEKEVKPPANPNHRTPIRRGTDTLNYAALNKIHTKVAEVEGDNSVVEATHKMEQKAESLARYSVRTAKYINGQKKAAPYKKAERLKHKADKAEVKTAYEKAIAENPKAKKSALKKFQQKQRIKKQYQKAKRTEQTAKAAKKTAQNTEKAARRLASFIWRHKTVIGIILAIVLLIAWLGTLLSSCSVMTSTGTNAIMVSSYFAEDEDIYAAEDYYTGLEQDLQAKINGIEQEYSGYDEYRYNLAQIGHNPYELISYLTAVYQDFKFNDIKGGLDSLFNSQYHLTITETSEQRTDSEGNTYTYKILNVTLTNEGMTNSLTAEQQELYAIYMSSKGNRDYLFADDIYANETAPPNYTIPGEALNDETFRKLITEAEKYLGYPYVWGGSSPSTSFDCSGFVCWVFKNSGVYPLGRTTAQGIYNQCAVISSSEAKPGDIIFFKGTYNTSDVSHVGIYVGNGMMIHCGSPIQYASVNSNYWRQHFYAYGRLSN